MVTPSGEIPPMSAEGLTEQQQPVNTTFRKKRSTHIFRDEN